MRRRQLTRRMRGGGEGGRGGHRISLDALQTDWSVSFQFFPFCSHTHRQAHTRTHTPAHRGSALVKRVLLGEMRARVAETLFSRGRERERRNKKKRRGRRRGGWSSDDVDGDSSRSNSSCCSSFPLGFSRRDPPLLLFRRLSLLSHFLSLPFCSIF